MKLSAQELRVYGLDIAKAAPTDSLENALAALDEARRFIHYVFGERRSEEPDQTPKA
jgi:hypothetical protein